MRGSRSGVMRVLYGTAMALVGFWAGTAMAAPGDTLWSRTVGTNAFDVVQDAATDANGNLYVVGVTWGDMTGDYKGEGDAFVLKLDPQGRILWRRQPGSAGYDEALGVAIDKSNNVYVVGQTEGAFAGLNKGDDDAFLLKYDTDGRLLWRRQPGTSRKTSPGASPWMAAAMSIWWAAPKDRWPEVTRAVSTFSCSSSTVAGGPCGRGNREPRPTTRQRRSPPMRPGMRMWSASPVLT